MIRGRGDGPDPSGARAGFAQAVWPQRSVPREV